MEALEVLEDPVGSLLVWALLSLLFWLVLSALVRPRRTPAMLVAASVSWIIARLFLWALPLILQQVEAWFGT